MFNKNVSYCLSLFATGMILLNIVLIKNKQAIEKFSCKETDVIAIVTNIEYRDSEIIELNIKKVGDVNSDVYARWSTNKSSLQIGDTIHIYKATLRTQIPRGLQITSYADFLIKENIQLLLSPKKPFYKVISKSTSLRKLFNEKRESLLSSITKKLNPSAKKLFSCIYMGKKNQTPNRNQFNYWGISHYLARSGLHVALIITSWAYMLKFFPLPMQVREIIILTLCLIYGLLSFPSISFLRAFIILILFIFGKILKKQTHPLYLLTTVCFFVIIFNPIQVLFLDFQLSFSLTFALLYNFYVKDKNEQNQIKRIY